MLDDAFAKGAADYKEAALAAIAKWLAFEAGHANPETLVWVDDDGRPVELPAIVTPAGKATPRPRHDDGNSAPIWKFYTGQAYGFLYR
jgi:hypothetical protein